MTANPMLVFLGQAAILVCVPYLIWRLPSVRIFLPLIVIQILLGVALGPSLLGAALPAASALLQGDSLTALSGVAWLAVVMFAFLTGLHFDLAETTKRSRSFLAIALGSVSVPAALGLLLGFALIERSPGLEGPAADPLLFACSVSVAMAVTALPVLGAILRETGLIADRIGRDALGLAAINDLLLWILLAAVLSIAQARSVEASVLLPLALGVGYLLAMFLVLKPLAAHLLRPLITMGTCRESDLVAVVAMTILSAWVTESIGLHYILGSFVAGAILPPACARPLIRAIEPFTVVVLLPFFFILTGLRTHVQLDGDGFLLVFVLSTAVAVLGKMVGTVVPARLGGERWSYSVRLGALMQCKGLMDVVVLSVLFDAGILSELAFSAMVLMAVVTTAATKPMLLLCDAMAQRARMAARHQA